MKLQPINPPLREGQRVQCCVCFSMVYNAQADLDGEAFKAFYCNDCAHKVSVTP